jgi:hypothetical protein
MLTETPAAAVRGKRAMGLWWVAFGFTGKQAETPLVGNTRNNAAISYE